jgi:hypothetical protein
VLRAEKSDLDSMILKIAISIALVHEGNGFSTRGVQIFGHVEDIFYRRLKVHDVKLKELIVLTLMVRPIRYIFQ